MGQIRVNLQDKSSDQTEAILGDACAELVTLADTFECPICMVANSESEVNLLGEEVVSTTRLSGKSPGTSDGRQNS
ncbi:MAG: hypothetical protein F6J89_00670 [Symploca sp. SIO1C4]|uniref:Uncharacterized protein n=1 Tax=Symploca sp. SIO1C4 TaxID=2607765 RepID=A0A6B3MXQ4_9CYAN|nr:hypothetical protein [Symploca sp. SIO1C4]